MSNPCNLRFWKWLTVAALVGLISLQWAQITRADAPQPDSPTSAREADRYLTAVSTDKPIYREGEIVYVRGVLLQAFTHKPFTAKNGASAQVRIFDPKGAQVTTQWVTVADGAFGSAWQVPEGQAGGEYRLEVSYPHHGYPTVERKFDIRAYRVPRLKTEIVFLRDGYVPGDKVAATLQVSRAEGGIPAGAKVTSMAVVDGAEIARQELQLDADGRCTAQFKLPAEIVSGDGTLAMTVEDGGVVESAGKTIPILLSTVDVALYPEGGDLIVGLPGQVYMEARRKNGKPADIAGVVLDAEGNQVSAFRTVHEGRGAFVLPAVTAGGYTLKITQPEGLTTAATLPLPKAQGVVLHAQKQIYAPGEAIDVMIGNTTGDVVELRISKRDVKLTNLFVMAGAETVKTGPWQGCALATLKPPSDFDGVLTVTAFDKEHKPVAERLVFRQPRESLQIELKADQKQYIPGGKVNVTVKTTVDGKPVAAVVGLTASDDSVLKMLEQRDRPPRLSAMALLEPDVRELADTEIYLADSSAKSTQALDLLLGTQGWRRFVWLDSEAFQKVAGEPAYRALALKHPVVVPPPTAATGWDRGGHMRVPAAPGAVPGDADGAIQGNAEGAPAEVQNELGRPVAKPMREAEKKKGKQRIRQEAQAHANAPMAVAEMDMKADDEMGVANQRRAVYYVREYAHQAAPARKTDERTDFTETVYWNAGLKTDAATGEAKISFDLSDAVTTFHLFADGCSTVGGLGAAQIDLESVKPFYIEPKLPLELTAGDVMQLPVSFVNGTASPLAGVKFSMDLGGLTTVVAAHDIDLAASERKRQILAVNAGSLFGLKTLTFRGDTGLYQDSVTRSVTVQPLGFPLELSEGGQLDAATPGKHVVTIPEEFVPGSVKTKVALYVTPLGNMNQALERMIQEPYGCFEQTSSTSYPMTMAQQYFQTHTGVNPALVESAREKLDRSYKRLTSFECTEKGYEWFGQSPGHEALTAFGLLHFQDMAAVREVDPSMVTRTRDWLMKQRDGEGGFKRNRRALHTWIEDKDCSNGYILWSLLECGQTGLETEITGLKKAALASNNSYVWALSANAMALAGEKDTANTLMQKLAGRQGDQGEVTGAIPGATASIVGSRGDTLDIETTALTVLAWLRDPAFAGNAEKSIQFLNDACKGGRYGSTQSTVLALKAIIAHDQARAHPKVGGSAQLFVDGRPVGDPVVFTPTTQGAIELPDFASALTAGVHTIELKMQNGCPLPYCLTVNCVSTKPDSSPGCRLTLSTFLPKEKVQEGDAADVQVTVKNRSDKLAASPVAIIGLPAGLEPRHDQLKELVKAGMIDSYEVRGREVILYWRSLTAGQELAFPISTLAAVPGTYTAPASRVYEYYCDNEKTWVGGLYVTIAAK